MTLVTLGPLLKTWLACQKDPTKYSRLLYLDSPVILRAEAHQCRTGKQRVVPTSRGTHWPHLSPKVLARYSFPIPQTLPMRKGILPFPLSTTVNLSSRTYRRSNHIHTMHTDIHHTDRTPLDTSIRRQVVIFNFRQLPATRQLTARPLQALALSRTQAQKRFLECRAVAATLMLDDLERCRWSRRCRWLNWGRFRRLKRAGRMTAAILGVTVNQIDLTCWVFG